MRHSGFLSKVALALLLMCGILSGAGSVSAADAGDKCSKVGVTKVANGISLSCVKNSKGLKVWQKIKPPTKTCAQGGTCVVGDTGPGGGIVFYVAAKQFASKGSDCGSVCRYLEAAPTDVAGIHFWCSDNRTYLGVEAWKIGSGMSNTTTADLTCTSGAIQVAADYSNNDKTDWFLPSMDELSWFYSQGVYRDKDWHWSSSECCSEMAFVVDFYGGARFNTFKNNATIVRPVRAF